MSLQIKSPHQIKLYAFIISAIIVLGIGFYIFKKPFRKLVNDYIKSHIFFVSTFVTFHIVYLISRLFFPRTFFLTLFDEDGLFEYLTVIFFICASLFLILSISKMKTLFINIYILSIAFICFFIGMEEASWGQRIFGIETPESLKQINYQEEITVHNLVPPEYHPIIYLGISILCLIFFAFTNNRKYDSLFWVNREYLPSKKFLVIAFLLPFISWYNMEHFEVILSFMFFVYAFQLYKKRLRS